MIPEHVGTAKSGAAFLRAAAIHVNSPYDPVREALRFAASAAVTENPAAIVLLEPGAPHLARILGEKYPSARIVTIHHGTAFLGDGSGSFPERKDESLHSYLKRVLGDEDAESLSVLEWPRGTDAFPAESAAAKETLAEHLRAMAASLQTTGFSGRRWMKNRIHNASVVLGTAMPEGKPETVVIAASGPGLETTFPALARNRSKYVLAALSSAVTPLLERDILPDIVFSSDPGHWAARLLHSSVRGRLPLAILPQAALPAEAAARCRICFLSGDSPFETELFDAESVPRFPGTTSGTVLGTALDFWRRFSPASHILVAGADFASLDIASHARGHDFTSVFSARTDRYKPLYGTVWLRETEEHPVLMEGSWRSSPRLSRYSGWLSRELGNSGSIHWISTSPSCKDAFPRMPPETLDGFLSSRRPGTFRLEKTGTLRRNAGQTASRILSASEEEYRRGAATGKLSPIARELGMSLDCPGYLTLRKLERASRTREQEGIRERIALAIERFRLETKTGAVAWMN